MGVGGDCPCDMTTNSPASSRHYAVAILKQNRREYGEIYKTGGDNGEIRNQQKVVLQVSSGRIFEKTKAGPDEAWIVFGRGRGEGAED